MIHLLMKCLLEDSKIKNDNINKNVINNSYFHNKVIFN